MKIALVALGSLTLASRALGQVTTVNPRLAADAIKKSTPEHEFHKAAACGYTDKLKELIQTKQIANVDFLDPKCNARALNFAVRNGHFLAAKFLLDNGADGSIKNRRDWTYLHIACNNGRVDVVGLLLARGASVTDKNCNGDTPLNLACWYQTGTYPPYGAKVNAEMVPDSRNAAEMVRMIIEHAVNEHRDKARTHIEHAVSVHRDMARTLLEQTEEHDYFCESITSMFIRCYVLIKKHDIDFDSEVKIRMIMEYQNIRAHSVINEHREALARTVIGHASGNLQEITSEHREMMVRMLIEYHESISASNFVWMYGYMDMALTLIKYHALIGKHGIACESSYRMLVLYYTFINSQNDFGSTPLSSACNCGHANVSAMLIQCGANIELVNNKYSTPLHQACERGRLETIRMLLQNGAQVLVTDIKRSTPMHLACQRRSSQPNKPCALIVKLLLEYGAGNERVDIGGYTPLHTACHYCLPEAALMLINSGANIHVRDRNGQTLMHAACKRGKINVVLKLIESGVNIDILDNDEQTPLHIACYYGRLNVISKFIELDRSMINLRDKRGETALHIACYWGNLKIVLELIKHDVDATTLNWMDESPIYIARRLKRWTVVDVLIEHAEKQAEKHTESDVQTVERT